MHNPAPQDAFLQHPERQSYGGPGAHHIVPQRLSSQQDSPETQGFGAPEGHQVAPQQPVSSPEANGNQFIDPRLLGLQGPQFSPVQSELQAPGAFGTWMPGMNHQFNTIFPSLRSELGAALQNTQQQFDHPPQVPGDQQIVTSSAGLQAPQFMNEQQSDQKVLGGQEALDTVLGSLPALAVNQFRNAWQELVTMHGYETIEKKKDTIDVSAIRPLLQAVVDQVQKAMAVAGTDALSIDFPVFLDPSFLGIFDVMSVAEWLVLHNVVNRIDGDQSSGSTYLIFSPWIAGPYQIHHPEKRRRGDDGGETIIFFEGGRSCVLTAPIRREAQTEPTKYRGVAESGYETACAMFLNRVRSVSLFHIF